jgi:hypothetical protein
MHTVSVYPCPEEDLNLNMEVYKLLKDKQQQLSLKIGAVVLH